MATKITSSLLSKEDIFLNPHKTLKGLGFIYFLERGGEVVYVGQTKDIDSRVYAHKYKGKVFDNVYTLSCPVCELDEKESLYINKFKPIENYGRFGSSKVRLIYPRSKIRDFQTNSLDIMEA